MKHVLFLTPGFAYAKTVAENLEAELRRKHIKVNIYTDYDYFFVETEKACVKIVFIDPIHWTEEMLRKYKYDAFYGKRELVNILIEKFGHFYAIHTPKISLTTYVIQAHCGTDDPSPKHEQKPFYIPEIKNVYFNNPVTVVMWSDGTKTSVRCQEGDEYSKEAGLALCISKKALGNKSSFNNIFKKWIPEEKVHDITVDNNDIYLDGKPLSKLFSKLVKSF